MIDQLEDYASYIRVRRPDLATRNNPVSSTTFLFESRGGHPLIGVDGINGPVRWGPIIDADGTPFLVFVRQPGRAVTSDLAASDILKNIDSTVPEWMPLEAEASITLKGTRASIRVTAPGVQALYDKVGPPHQGGSFIANNVRPRLSRGCVRRIHDDHGNVILFAFYLALE